ncbi:MAG TPA: protein kinase, partial [Acidobacteriota bacterium]|nr:protein kinase [Acidobacteriota bacterium]
MIGREVSHFRILEEIGQGGMGKVYLAQDSRLDRRVALKFLGDRFQEDPVALKRFLREAKSAAGLDDPFICSIFQVGEGRSGPAFIAMEFVPGETLEARLKRGLPELRQALQWAVEISEALQCAHEKSLVHRDLKPANIMITPSGHVKVMDFGLAKRLDPIAEDDETRFETITSTLTREGTTPGTLAYMSPEQLKGGELDTRSDLFAFGIIFYQALTGVHPFKRPSPMETASAILREDPPPLSRLIEPCPPLLQETMAGLLAKEPSQRFAKAEEVSQRLNLLLDRTARSGDALGSAIRRTLDAEGDDPTLLGSPTSAGTRVDPPRAAKRRLWPAWAAAAVLLLVLLMFIPGVRATLGGWVPFLAPAAEFRVAILPFDNYGVPSEEASLLQGLDSNLTRRLAQLPELRGSYEFVAPDQAASLAGEGLQRLWDDLGTRFALRGSLHQTGQHLWLTANLFDAQQGTNLHSVTLDVAGQESSAAEDDLAQRVAQLLRQEQRARLADGQSQGQDKTHYQIYQEGMDLLRRYDREGNVDQAVEKLQSALSKKRDYAPAHAGLAEANWRSYRRSKDQMHLEQALTHSERALELDPQLALTHVSRGLAHLAAGNWAECEASLDQALKLDPSNAKAFYVMGLLRQAQKRLEQAQGFFEKALAEDPDYWDALTELGAIHYSAGRYKEAEEAFLRTIELRPDSHIGYRNLGGIRMLRGDLSGAAANFQKSLEIRPEAAAYSNLGTLQFFRGLYAESAAAYEKAIQMGAGDYLIWANLGDAYRQLPQSAQKAEEAFQIAIQKMRELLQETPEDPNLLVQLAVALAKSGRPQEALQVAESVPDS